MARMLGFLVVVATVIVCISSIPGAVSQAEISSSPETTISPVTSTSAPDRGGCRRHGRHGRHGHGHGHHHHHHHHQHHHGPKQDHTIANDTNSTNSTDHSSHTDPTMTEDTTTVVVG
ncbi:protein doublesex-like [Periplaneta americana]|uniref:protein doublesex-like n=1 Tax=Periplaneta americana TaxID=6978 RepID=UPI0037E994B8